MTTHQIASTIIKLYLYAAIATLLLLVATSVTEASTTVVPGHERFDADHNGHPDAGQFVNGHYTSVYAYDDANWYWDLGDGRVQGTVPGIEYLDPEFLTVCDYVINYRADFGNDEFMNTGSILNLINCSGYDDNNQYNYLIVHKDDPRYTGNPDWAVWGDWEYHNLITSKFGNLVKHYIQ
ncbi:MAG: hypothetical protein AAB388_00850 [Patescibacteria group bacterium]